MQCKSCGKTFGATETVYRTRGGGVWHYGPPGTIGELCAACSQNSVWASHRGWREPLACEKCGRPVRTDRRFVENKHNVCSDECQARLYSALAYAKRRRTPPSRACECCGLPFRPKRADAKYCSAACKQKAHRRAKKEAAE